MKGVATSEALEATKIPESVLAQSNNKSDFELPRVGIRITFFKLVCFFLIWLILALFFTGFGYQPLWLCIVIYIVGATTTFSIVFKSPIQFYDNYMTCGQCVILSESPAIYYDSIEEIRFEYVKRPRYSPFDINPDNVFLDIYSDELGKVRVDLSSLRNKDLREIILFLIHKKVEIKHNNKLISAVILDKNLYEIFH